MSGRAVLIKTIDSSALVHNWQQIRRRSSARRLLAVVKSNAYGHGLAAVAGVLADQADGFAVVALRDAIALRAQGIRLPVILLQGFFSPDNVDLLAEQRLTPVIHSGWQLQALAGLPATAQLTVYLKFNSGMNRLGFPIEEAAAVIDAARQNPAIADIVLMSHFADADCADGLKAPLQEISALRGYRLPLSLSNSAAAILHDDIGDDWGRIGIALYGASPAPDWRDREALGLRPVMTWSTRLIAVRTVAAGGRIGYGGEYTADSDMKVGIASVGYGDGYPRHSGLMAAIHNTLLPIIGRVSMEMIALDLRGCGNAAVGDEVVLWGEYPSADQVAAAAGTIAYDLFTKAKGEGVVG